MPPSVGRIALKSISGRKAGEDHARSQCPEKHTGTQGPLRGDENSWRAKETLSPLNGSPFSEKTCSSFQSEDLFFVLGIR
ncbi:hypothetical protein RJ60_12035 [Mesotoga sp. B105.6.4]|nr:hypothetical protein RJ60_12035 [Mesotoga sp. B105.6.4]